MSNICDNKFYIYSKENAEAIDKKLEKLFKEELDGEITYKNECVIEGHFDSSWTFPDEIFENFFEEFEDDTIYMRCLSEEWGMDLCSMNIYKDGAWWDPQYFDV